MAIVPLSYESTKTVIQYMEANTRIRLAKHCPMLQKTEKTVPLHVSYLYMTNVLIKVNDQSYVFGVHREYPPGVDVPISHQRANDDGGSHEDLDEYGVPFYGDYDDLDGTIDFLVQEIRGYEYRRNNSNDPEVVEYLQKQIEECQIEISTLANKRDGVLPPYKMWLQLTVETPSNEKIVERVEYTKKIGEAKAQLASRFFHNYQHPVSVKHMRIMDNIFETFEFSNGMKFRIRELSIRFELASQLSELEKIIDPECLPLDVLNTTKPITSAQDLAHPLERTAKRLVINCARLTEPLFTVLPKLSNRHVHLVLEELSVYDLSRIYSMLKKVWGKNVRELGSTFTMDFGGTAMKCLSVLQRLIRDFTAPLSPTTEIRIALTCDEEKGTLKSEVISMGSAV